MQEPWTNGTKRRSNPAGAPQAQPTHYHHTNAVLCKYRHGSGGALPTLRTHPHPLTAPPANLKLGHRELDLAFMGKEAPHVGFPEAALPKYADKLVALGHKAGSIFAAHDSRARPAFGTHSCPSHHVNHVAQRVQTTQSACALICPDGSLARQSDCLRRSAS
eukprot:scaffold24398_cov133-Isochrysis_galbana.AAC.10